METPYIHTPLNTNDMHQKVIQITPRNQIIINNFNPDQLKQALIDIQAINLKDVSVQ